MMKPDSTPPMQTGRVMSSDTPSRPEEASTIIRKPSPSRRAGLKKVETAGDLGHEAERRRLGRRLGDRAVLAARLHAAGAQRAQAGLDRRLPGDRKPGRPQSPQRGGPPHNP